MLAWLDKTGKSPVNIVYRRFPRSRLLGKTCNACGFLKLVGEFYFTPRDQKMGPTSKGENRCKLCRNDSTKKYWDSHQVARKRSDTKSHYRSRYGISFSDVEHLIEEQGNACAICLRSFEDTRKQMDHSHETGEVRGWLCPSCNRAVGLLRDDPERFERAAAYLRAKHNIATTISLLS